jgi:hypothetical protein
MYHLDITNVVEAERGDLSQRIHELQDTGLNVIKVGSRDIGEVGGDGGHLTVPILRDMGYNVSLYHGCGHCLQGMERDGGRCDCECHS